MHQGDGTRGRAKDLRTERRAPRRSNTETPVYPSTTRCLVCFNHVDGVGPMRLAQLVAHFGSVEAAWEASERQLRAVVGPSVRASMYAARERIDPDAVLEGLHAIGARVVTIYDDAYPEQLRSVPNAPFLLYVLGDPAALRGSAVSVVGTRRPSGYGEYAAVEMASGLAAQGVTIVSGMALGIDGIAHRAAIEAGGTTVAVLGSGVDVPYPRRHEPLMRQIAKSGAVVSEFPPGTPAMPKHFPSRNRIVSGLSVATLVIEAGPTSGALITARCALDQGREVLAVPGPINSRRSAGTNKLLADGAGFAASVDDVLDTMKLSPLGSRMLAQELVPGNAVEASLQEQLGLGPMHIDDLIRATGLSGAEVACALSVMELKGHVRNMGDMCWMLHQ